MPIAEPAAATPGAPPRTTAEDFAAARGWILAILTLANALNFLDRQIAFILAEPIKIDLHLSDTQLGLLTGLAFAILYTTLGIPLARVADRPGSHRVRLISLSIAAWSIMTAVCGLAQNFTQLLTARIAVGVGEAGVTPAAQAVLTEIFPQKQRARALATYLSGIPLGKLFGLIIGGLVAQALGWRAAFALVGLPGLLVAFAAWRLIPEPRRRLAAQPAQASSETFGESVRALAKIPSYWFGTLGCTIVSFVTTAQTAFLGSFLIRSHGFNVGSAGLALGLAVGGGGLIGALLAGAAADAGAHKDARAYVAIPGFCSIAGAAIFMPALYVHSTWAVLALLALSQALLSTWYGPVAAMNQHLAGPLRRSMAVGISLFIINLIGIGFGPLIAGRISDVLHHGVTIGGLVLHPVNPAEGLRTALAIVTATTLLGTLCFAIAAMRVRRDMAASEDGVGHV